jgi:hypothetical protein
MPSKRQRQMSVSGSHAAYPDGGFGKGVIVIGSERRTPGLGGERGGDNTGVGKGDTVIGSVSRTPGLGGEGGGDNPGDGKGDIRGGDDTGVGKGFGVKGKGVPMTPAKGCKGYKGCHGGPRFRCYHGSIAQELAYSDNTTSSDEDEDLPPLPPPKQEQITMPAKDLQLVYDFMGKQQQAIRGMMRY